MLKKILSVLLALTLAFSVCALPALAAAPAGAGYTSAEKAEHLFYRLLDRLVYVLGKILNFLIPGADWTGRTPTLKNYTSQYFYPGAARFRTAPAAGAKWRMGFAKRSFLTGIDPLCGKYYMAGTLTAFEGRVPAAVADDQGVNAFVLSDGSAAVAYAAVDGYGLTRGDVLAIRARVEETAARYGIVSVNVSALHQHSCIDILGLGAPLGTALINNPGAELFYPAAVISGRDPEFLENVTAATAAAITEAAETMTEGTLYYGAADISDYLKDKREPVSFDPLLHRLRFVPDNAALNEIWVCETGMHPVSLGAGTDVISGDYPHYLEQYAKAHAGADLVFIQGAELAITSRSEALSYDASSSPAARAIALGSALGAQAESIKEETALPPLLNAAHREVTVEIDNQILTLAGREGLIGSVFVKKGLGYAAVTEIGYMELGGTLGVLLAPGEIEPAILRGGAPDADMSWTGQTWPYAPLAECCGVGTLLCFGLCNDQIGYILCDNDVRSMFTENEEVNAASLKAGSTLTEAWGALFAEVR